jgi:hypothetical protein
MSDGCETTEGCFVDVDTTDDFLDYPELLYQKPDGTVGPLFTPEELERLGELYDEPLKIPKSPDR